MKTRRLTKSDYDEIVREIDRWWGGPTTALAHPMFYYELGDLARVVEDAGMMVGFLFGFLCPDGKTGYIHLVGIHPDYRRRGVARMLYTAFEDDCRHAAYKRLRAITTPGNEASIAFRHALGWTSTEVDDYAGPGRRRIVFTKVLPPG